MAINNKLERAEKLCLDMGIDTRLICGIEFKNVGQLNDIINMLPNISVLFQPEFSENFRKCQARYSAKLCWNSYSHDYPELGESWPIYNKTGFFQQLDYEPKITQDAHDEWHAVSSSGHKIELALIIGVVH